MKEVLMSLNPLGMSSGIALSNNNLTGVFTASSGVRATHGKTIGKWYWEVKLDSGNNSLSVGVINVSSPLAENTFTDLNSRGYYGFNGSKYAPSSPYGTAIAVGDVIGMLLDLDSGKLEFYKNGISMGIAFDDLKTLGEVYPFIRSHIATTKTITINLGSTPFKYPIPVGYHPYNNIYDNKILISSGLDRLSLSGGNVIENIKMDSENKDGNIVSSSTNFNSSQYNHHLAFDKEELSKVNGWLTTIGNTTGWLKYEFNKSRKVIRYSIGVMATYTTRMPKNWTFEGSNDDVNFVVLDTQTNVTSWTSNTYKDFTISNMNSYKFYRLNVSANNGETNYVGVGELKLFYFEDLVIHQLQSASELNFVNHGMDKPLELDISAEISQRTFIEQSPTTLDSGKVFKKSIDTAKVPIKKVTIK